MLIIDLSPLLVFVLFPVHLQSAVGKDIRKELKYPTFHELYADVKRHYETIRKYAQLLACQYKNIKIAPTQSEIIQYRRAIHIN